MSGAAGEEDEPSSPLLSYWGASCVGGGGVSFPTVLGSISLAFVDMGLATGGCFPSLLLEASLDGASALGVAQHQQHRRLGVKYHHLKGVTHYRQEVAHHYPVVPRHWKEVGFHCQEVHPRWVEMKVYSLR